MLQDGYLSPSQFDERVAHLVGNVGGLVKPATEIFRPSGSQEMCGYGSQVADLNRLHGHVHVTGGGSLDLMGGGSGATREQSRIKAVFEALERYSNCCHDPAGHVVASADELGDKAVDLDSFPRGSAREYQASSCPHRPPDKTEPLRWVRGISLTTGRETFVPLLSVFLSSKRVYPGEAFVSPISTGSAIAASHAKAAWTGLCEVAERDSLAITWLQRLALPRISVDGITDPVFTRHYRELQRLGIRQHFFNATSDLGIPTVYGIQESDHGLLRLLVMAATRPTILDAMIRIMEEAVAQRATIIGVEHSKPRLFSASDFATFTSLEDGARFYADGTHNHVFEFLTGGSRTQTIEDIPPMPGQGSAEYLRHAVAHFAALGCEVIAADMTPAPLRAAGLVALKIIVPQLMPLSSNHNMRFLGTPRLHQAPVRMGHAAHPEADLNEWPQPFA